MNAVPFSPVDAAAYFATARLFPVIGDYCQPMLDPGDFVAIAPADGYDGDGLYCLHIGAGPALYQVNRVFGSAQIEFRAINPAYSTWRRSLAEFDGSVLGRVFATVKITDHRELRRISQ